MIVIDAAKVPSKEGGECIVQRDRGSLRVQATESKGAATCASDTLNVLNELKASGRLPLVIGTDNGSTFVANEVSEFMDENKIVHIKSLPRVPQQNGSAENAVGDVKRLVKDGETLKEACRILNDCRKRQSINWKTPTELDQENFQPCTEEKRTAFYNAAKLAIQLAQLGTKTAYEKRKAEREAILQTMENFSLITRTRGHRCA
jgi:transposase InsO family protein